MLQTDIKAREERLKRSLETFQSNCRQTFYMGIVLVLMDILIFSIIGFNWSILFAHIMAICFVALILKNRLQTFRRVWTLYEGTPVFVWAPSNPHIDEWIRSNINQDDYFVFERIVKSEGFYGSLASPLEVEDEIGYGYVFRKPGDAAVVKLMVT